MSHSRPYCGALTLGVLVLLVAVYIDCLAGLDGRRIVHGLEGTARGSLVAVPRSERGVVWAGAELTTTLFLSLPLFIAAGERAPFFEALFDVNGRTAAVVHGVAYSSHAAVSSGLAAVVQPGEMLMGGTAVSHRCLSNATLLFVGTSHEHERMRNFLAQHLKQPSGGEEVLDLTPASSPTGSVSADVRRAVVTAVFAQLWGAPLSAESTEVVMDYFQWGAMCYFGDFVNKINIATAGLALRRVDRIRSEALSAVLETPVGKHLVEAAEAEFGEGEGERVLAAAVDGMLFAGLRGTAQLVEGIVERIGSSPLTMRELWKKDPASFILEHSRLDPPVLTSINSVVTKQSEQTVGAGWLGQLHVNMEPGSVTQLVLSHANRDPAVFGGPLHLPSRAKQFDPTRGAELEHVLTFNNVLDMSATRPRGPAYGLTGACVRTLVEHFLPLESPLVSAEADAAQPSKSTDGSVQLATTLFLRSSHSDFYEEIFGRQSFLDDFAFVIWGSVCIWGIVCLTTRAPQSPPPATLILRLGATEAAEAWRKRPNLVGRHYEFYLLSQFGTALAHFVGGDLLQQMMQATAAASYASLALRVDEYFKKRDAWDIAHHRGDPTPSHVQLALKTNPKSRSKWDNLSKEIRVAYTEQIFTYEYAGFQDGYFCVMFLWALLFCALSVGHIFAPNSFRNGSVAVGVFYTPACKSYLTQAGPFSFCQLRPFASSLTCHDRTCAFSHRPGWLFKYLAVSVAMQGERFGQTHLDFGSNRRGIWNCQPVLALTFPGAPLPRAVTYSRRAPLHPAGLGCCQPDG